MESPTDCPPPDYRDRLWQRNEYYILSHHPLRETLMQQMGSSQERRVDFLGSVWKDTSGLGTPIWTPAQLAESVWHEQVWPIKTAPCGQASETIMLQFGEWD